MTRNPLLSTSGLCTIFSDCELAHSNSRQGCLEPFLIDANGVLDNFCRLPLGYGIRPPNGDNFFRTHPGDKLLIPSTDSVFQNEHRRDVRKHERRHCEDENGQERAKRENSTRIYSTGQTSSRVGEWLEPANEILHYGRRRGREEKLVSVHDESERCGVEYKVSHGGGV